MVLFPKVTMAAALKTRRPAHVLLASAATLLQGLGLTAVVTNSGSRLIYVGLVFRGEYADPGALLQVVGRWPRPSFARVNIWLSYALSVGKRPNISSLPGALFVSIGNMPPFFIALLLLNIQAFVPGDRRAAHRCKLP
ncbi:MAG: hypothetical protein IPK53_07590 [bacterium]|nr:hypothetical protein [bacterium]